VRMRKDFVTQLADCVITVYRNKWMTCFNSSSSNVRINLVLAAVKNDSSNDEDGNDDDDWKLYWIS
jgi:hypothetical protein